MEMLADAAAADLDGGVPSPPTGLQLLQPPAGALIDPQGNDGAQETTAAELESELTVKQKSAPGAAGMEADGLFTQPIAASQVPSHQPGADSGTLHQLHNADATTPGTNVEPDGLTEKQDSVRTIKAGCDLKVADTKQWTEAWTEAPGTELLATAALSKRVACPLQRQMPQTFCCGHGSPEQSRRPQMQRSQGSGIAQIMPIDSQMAHHLLCARSAPCHR